MKDWSIKKLRDERKKSTSETITEAKQLKRQFQIKKLRMDSNMFGISLNWCLQIDVFFR
jgi:hypothetical protein